MSAEKFACAWRLAVGPLIDRAARATWRDDGTVVVVARDPTWRRELTRSRAHVAQRLDDLLGRGIVKRIRIMGKDG